MRIPKNFTDNLKKGTITDEMLSECLFSVNKRAKNYRDKERQYRNSYRYDAHDNEGTNREKKENYYKMKEKLLSILQPKCIHVEEKNCKRRIYDYDPEYDEYCNSDAVEHRKSYYNRDLGYEVDFVDILEKRKKYYLFYALQSHSFHTPINENDLEKYSGLDIVPIRELNTYGEEIKDLISVQFVREVIRLIETGEYTYKEEAA